MYRKVPGTTPYVNASGLHEHAAVFRLRGIDGDPHRAVVEAASAFRIELPAMPGAPEHGRTGELVLPGLAGDALAHGAEAERPPVMRTAVADAAQLSVHCEHSDLAPSHAGDDAAVAFEVRDRTHVLPVA